MRIPPSFGMQLTRMANTAPDVLPAPTRTPEPAEPVISPNIPTPTWNPGRPSRRAKPGEELPACFK